MGTYTYLNTRGDRWVAQQIDEDVKTFPPQSQPPVNNSELRMWLAMFELELRKLSSVSVYFFHCSAVIQNPLPLFITHLVIWIPGKPVPALGTSCSPQHQSQTMIHVTVFCVTVNTMSCFQNKSALAKINKDFLIVQSNGYISALTFLALLALMVLTTLSLNLARDRFLWGLWAEVPFKTRFLWRKNTQLFNLKMSVKNPSPFILGYLSTWMYLPGVKKKKWESDERGFSLLHISGRQIVWHKGKSRNKFQDLPR